MLSDPSRLYPFVESWKAEVVVVVVEEEKRFPELKDGLLCSQRWRPTGQ